MKTRTKSIKQNLTIQQAIKPRKKSQSRQQFKSKPSNQSFIKQPPKSLNKENQDAKRYLQKTLNILSHRFNIREGISNCSSILNLSSSLYKIVKENLNSDKKVQAQEKQNHCPNVISTKLVNKQSHSKIKDEILKNTFLSNSIHQNDLNSSKKPNNRDSRKVILSQKQAPKPRTSSAMANYSSILQASSICQQQNSIIASNNPQNAPSSENSLFVKRRSNSTLDSYFREKFGTNAQDEQAVEKKLRVIKALKKSQQIVTKSNRSHIQSSMVLSSCDINDKSVVMEKLKNKNPQKIR